MVAFDWGATATTAFIGSGGGSSSVGSSGSRGLAIPQGQLFQMFQVVLVKVLAGHIFQKAEGEQVISPREFH